MFYRLLADGVVILHLAFVLFVLFGGLLTLWWPRILWLHLSAAAWGATVEFGGWICPLTPLEQWLRLEAGQPTYSSDFIEHYILPVLYPATLTHDMQLGVGMLVVALNAAIYGWLLRRTRHAS